MAANTRARPRAPQVVLDVTRELIEGSVRANSAHCMIAEAVRIAYPAAKYISVDVQTIRFTDPGKALRFTYLTPRVAQVSLVNFDMGDLPDPFTVRLSGGHVGRAMVRSRARRGETQVRTKAQVEAGKTSAGRAREAMSATLGEKADGLAKAQLVHRAGMGAGAVPDRVGGQAPPRVPGGRRREFGLRSFERRLTPQEGTDDS